MTYSPERYEGYPPIETFVGKDFEDLNKNIDEYLNDLMLKINKPLKECPHCMGQGVV